MYKPLTGTGVAVITPFHDYGTIDFTSLQGVINHTIEGGVDFLLALGTTSESATLSKDERTAVLEYFIETVDRRVPIMLGVGGNNTQDVVNNLKSINFEGVNSILSVAPYYNKPNQKGLYNHFKTIASASPVPVYLYNVPSRTSVNITAETTLKLATDINNIVGIKEASGNFEQIMQITKNKPKDFVVLSGDDMITLPLISCGVSGVISVVANAFPAHFSKMVNLALEGEFEKARPYHNKLMDIINTLFEDGSPGGVKAALDIMGICKNNLRLPLVKVNKKVYLQLKAQIEQFNS